MPDQKNLFIAIAVSLAVLLGFQYFYEFPKIEAQRKVQAEAQKDQPAKDGANPAANVQPGSLPDATQGDKSVAATREQQLAASPRVVIRTDKLNGSIALAGGRLDDLTLAKYHETIDPKSPEIKLLSPPGAPNAYYAEFGWTKAPADTVKLPDANTVWTADADTLTVDKPVVLSWDNGQGLVFRRKFQIDDNYLFTVTQSVENKGDAAATLFPWGLVLRQGTPHTDGTYILHEGPLGVFRDKPDSSGTLKELSYSDVAKAGSIDIASDGGWIGITDKYWLTALIPENTAPVKARFAYAKKNTELYQFDLRGAGQAIEPGKTISDVTRLFAGAKVVGVIDRYQEDFKIARFDRAIDWGWFYFLTRPMFYGIDYFFHLYGNFGLAILTITIIVKILFFPLAYKSFVSMSHMKALQPEMMALREKHGEDRAKLNEEMMALYKRAKVNPAAGCIPILLQIPVFYALYKVLYTTIEMRQAPFYGWIHDLSAPDPTTWINLFGLLPFNVPNLGPLQIISIGAWPLIMGVTMWLQMKANPQPPDPMQARIMNLMPIVFTFMLGSFAAGLVIYWSWNNTLSIAQQFFITRRVAKRHAHQTHK